MSRGFAGPRTIVTTDPELDDLNSMLRLLLYANEIDIVGLVYSSSRFHHAGDPAAGVAPHRWPAPGSVFHIDEAVNAYGEAYPHLVVHDPRYPSPERLRSLIAWGNVTGAGDMAADTPGSNLIREVLLDDEPGRVFLQVWGGHNTVARALRSIEDEFGGSPGWEGTRDRISAKAVITSFGQQDETFADYIRPRWPGIESREVATKVWGYFARSVVAEADQYLLGAEWTRAHVTGVGPVGAAYRVWGDGRQMADGFDDEDYFGLSGYSAEELAGQGYVVWMPPQERGAFISEGDSSNFALLVDNGLRSWEHPGWGGWGGRQEPIPDDPASWTNAGAVDADATGAPREEWSSARWISDFQNDFAARLRWSVVGDYAAANHHPEAAIREGTDVVAAAGAVVRLTAVASDPDGDEVDLSWWQYREAGTSPAVLELAPSGATVEFRIPDDAVAGETLHVVLTVGDSGAPRLVRHQRVVVTVA